MRQVWDYWAVHADRPTLRRLAEMQGGAVTREQARRCGCPEPEIRRLIRAGDWVIVRRGVLAAAVVVEEPRRLRVAEAAAAWLSLGRRPVLSHTSAALLHRLVLPDDPVVQLTADPRTLRSRRGDGFLLHAATLAPHHTAEVDGLPVTSVARTVVDLGRRLPFQQAVVLADDALHRRLVEREELERVLRDCAVWPRVRRAALVVAASDELAESPLETLCRLLFARHGLPPPDRQTLIIDPRDGWHARVDFCWPSHRTVVEADGRLKYSTPADLWDEKLRQERIEEVGYAVLRVTWAQVTREPAATVARVLRAFLRGDRLRDGSGSPVG
jgi:Transcriptional regulator, AbiEi antitoxin/Protein of unknown function (DUF559)